MRSPFTICLQLCATDKRSKRFGRAINGNDEDSDDDIDALAGSKKDIESSKSLIGEDSEVQDERQLVLTGQYPADSPVVVSNITKVWSGADKQKALDRVCIHLDKNAVFGLLGPNGAGKSTLIKIMTGEEVATKGRVYIGGRDVEKHPEKTSSMIGVCPQFDVLWDDLTVEEHLLFYCRLKGVPRAYESKRVVRTKFLLCLCVYSSPFLSIFTSGQLDPRYRPRGGG